MVQVKSGFWLLVFLLPSLAISAPHKTEPKDIRSYLHKNANLHEFQYDVNLYEHVYDVKRDSEGVSSDTMFQKILLSAIDRLKARGIKRISICEVDHYAAAVGSYHITLKGEAMIGRNRFTVFRIGVYDDQNGFAPNDTAHYAGKEFVFYAMGKNSRGKTLWFPGGQPGIDNDYMSEDYWEYCDRRKMETLQERFK